VDDGKLSERTISDELPQVSSASSEYIEITDITPACFFIWAGIFKGGARC